MCMYIHLEDKTNGLCLHSRTSREILLLLFERNFFIFGFYFFVCIWFVFWYIKCVFHETEKERNAWWWWCWRMGMGWVNIYTFTNEGTFTRSLIKEPLLVSNVFHWGKVLFVVSNDIGLRGSDVGNIGESHKSSLLIITCF